MSSRHDALAYHINYHVINLLYSLPCQVQTCLNYLHFFFLVKNEVLPHQIQESILLNRENLYQVECGINIHFDLEILVGLQK